MKTELRFIDILIGAAIVIILLGITGTMDLHDQRVAAAHKRETLAAAKKEYARQERQEWARLQMQADEVWPGRVAGK